MRRMRMSLGVFQKVVHSARGGSAARFVLPRVVFEIEPGFVVGARLDARSRQVKRLGARELEPKTVEPFPNRSNLANPEDLRVALRSLAQIIGSANGSSGLLIPDGTVRVGILGFETLPQNPKDAEALVCWRMRENLPCAPEEARLAYQVLRREARNIELLVIAVKQSVLAEYEQLLESGNGGLALVLPVTAALLPLLSEGEGTGQLLLHVCAGWLTAVVSEGSRLRSWRTVELKSQAPEDVAREAALEAARVVASARDHLQVEVERVCLCERPRALPGLEQEVSRAVSKEVVRLEPASGVARALSESERSTFDSFGAAIAGLIANVG